MGISLPLLFGLIFSPELVIGTLDTPDYGLFVSHHHPDGQVCSFFSYFISPC